MPFSISAITLTPSPRFVCKYPKRPNLFHKNHPFSCSSSSLSRSLTMSMETNFDLKTYWASLITEINHKLDDAIPVQYPEKIYEAMRYSVLAYGAKRAAPIMCIAACELFGGSRLAAFPTACALEMVHEASLIHDDLPYMDDDLFRRERLSNHSIYGVDMAILAGDALFPLGFQHITTHTPPNLVPESRLVQVIGEIARAVGSTGMAAGQFLDLTNAESSLVEFVQEKKFGELSECSAACGALLGGATDDEVEKLRRYGRTVGVLYQVVEDVLDMKREETEEVVGKKKKKKKKGKLSFAKVFGVEKALEKAEELRVMAKKELDGFEKYGERVQPLISFVDYAIDRSFTIGDHVENGALGVNQAAGHERGAAADAEEAEAGAVRTGLQMAHRLKLQKLVILIDCQSLAVNLDRGGGPFSWGASWVQHDILRLSGTFGACSFHYISREHNSVAHSLAQRGRLAPPYYCTSKSDVISLLDLCKIVTTRRDAPGS